MIDIIASKAVPIKDVAMRLGLDVKGHRTRCVSRDHRDDNPSLSFDRRLNRFKCFGCELSGDVLDLVQIVMGMPLEEANAWLMGDTVLITRTPVPIEARGVRYRYSVALLTAFWRACDTSGDWLAVKGLDSGKFGVRKVTPEANRLIPQFPVGGLFIPYYQGGVITSARWRSTSKTGLRALSLPGQDVILYGQDSLKKLDGVRPLYLCEGETDTMSMLSRGAAALGFPGATQYRLIERIVGWLELLGDQVPQIILAFDNDEAGQRLDAKCREAFKGWKGSIKTLNLGEYKDVNDWYNHGYLPTKEK